jgi:dihydrofolate synthase/folylpolyglutamate synthase
MLDGDWSSDVCSSDLIAETGLGGEVVCHGSPQEAMQSAKGQASDSDRILAFGSFYTVAGALEALGKKA